MAAALAAIAMSGLMVGCASNKAAEGSNPVATWQAERFKADIIKAKNEQGKPVTLEDVQYKSAVGVPAIATAVDLLAKPLVENYYKVVTEVDQLNAYSDGRNLVNKIVGVKNAIAKAKDPDTKAENQKQYDTFMKELKPEQKKQIADYQKMSSQIDQTQVIESTIKPMLAKLAEEGAKLVAEIALLKDHPAFKTLAGFTAVKEGANLMKDSAALGDIVDDTIEGLEVLKQLYEIDRNLRAYEDELMRDVK